MHKQPLLTHKQIIRLPRLLDMQYTMKEIAEEIGVHPDTIRKSFIRRGRLPYKRINRTIWIHGLTFTKWAKEITKKRKIKKIPRNSAFCVRCKKYSKIKNAVVFKRRKYIKIIKSKCLYCLKDMYHFQRK